MRAGVIVAAVVAVLVFAGAAQAAPRYTVLGDSYAAGPLIPFQLPPFEELGVAQLRLREVPAVVARARSPLTRVLGVNCSAIFPHTGGGCYPPMPVAEGDVPYLRAKQEELNAMLADQAGANGATLVDVYGASVGHDACALPGVRGWSRSCRPMPPPPCTRTCSGCGRWPAWW